MSVPRKPQVRLRYSKHGKIRFTSHRDLARIWERAVRQIGLPVAYSEGFSPRAKLSFGLALPTVFESDAEFVDITLNEPGLSEIELESLPGRLNETLPTGVRVSAAVAIFDKVDSLQECVAAVDWAMLVKGDFAELRNWTDQILAADELMMARERKGKSRINDVRPVILSIDVIEQDPITGQTGCAPTGPLLEIRALLATKPIALRPLELLEINSASAELVLGRRVNQFIAPIGSGRDPIAVCEAEAPHSVSCAS